MTKCIRGLLLPNIIFLNVIKCITKYLHLFINVHLNCRFTIPSYVFKENVPKIELSITLQERHYYDFL